ncbi:Serine/threonine-protein kinase 52-like protein [Drosera capensis]
MDLNGGEADGDVVPAIAEKSDSKPVVVCKSNGRSMSFSQMSDVDNMSAKNLFFRADKIDFKNWDLQLEKHLSRVLSREMGTSMKKEEWEIDLAKLDLKSVIARGTYGTVYKGLYDGQDVAVKVLDWGEEGVNTVAEIAAIQASFKQEVSVWHKLEHPNVTKFIGASMGTSNLKALTSNNPNGNESLSYLHHKKIVHRDVKSENMLLDSRRTLKIADFGVARVEAQNPRDMTGETGTLGYMAPEVLDGKPYNRKCDVYSFGICLWEIYCCDIPYPNLSFADLSVAVVRQNVRPEIPKCCPSSLASIMKKCWDPNPDKRPDMDDVVKLLEAIDTSKGGGMIAEDEAVDCFCLGPRRGP